MVRCAAAWAAARCVGQWVQQQVASIEGATELHQVTDSLQAVLNVLIFGATSDQNRQQQLQRGACEVSNQLQQALLQQAQALGWPALQQCFYDDQYEAWATSVLTVAAGEWLPKDGDERLQQLVAGTFHCSPPAVALAALLGHLSAVLPKRSSNIPGPSSTTVTAIAAGTAADLLAERFAAPGSCGIKQLLQSCDTPVSTAAAAAAAAAGGPGQNSSEEPQQQQQQQQQCGAESQKQQQHRPIAWPYMPTLTAEQAAAAAQQLASIPDRVQQLPEVPGLLQPDCFVQQALQQAFEYISSCGCHIITSSSSSGGSSSCSNQAGNSNCSNQAGSSREAGSPPDQGLEAAAAAAAAAPGAAAFATQLLRKFVTRGHARHAAAALLQLGCCGGQACQLLGSMQLALLQLSSHTSATEKLLVQLLKQACLQHQQQVQGAAQQKEQYLKALLCPILAVSADLRFVAVHKLLLGRTLPDSCLRLLLGVLTAVRPSLVPEAAVRLAQAWSDQHTCLNVAVQQQAYMTAALVACIEMLPKAMLDPAAPPAQAEAAEQIASDLPGHLAVAVGAAVVPYQGVDQQQLAGLIPSILQGVSLRLASPSPAIRAQAMRVGRGFAAKLDPAKPLFEDAGELGLLPEEMWPGAPGHAAVWQLVSPQAQPQQQQAAAEAANGAAAMVDGSGSVSSQFQALQRLHEALIEPDSDDEEGAAAAAAAGLAHKLQHQQVGFDTKQASTTSGGTTWAAAAARDDGVSGADVMEGGIDNDDDAASAAGSEGSASSLVAFDLREDAAAEEWWGPDGLGPAEGKQLSLRGLAAALRKHDDVTAALDALSRVEVLVRAEPDELPVVAPELARSLLHCKVPIWASTPDPATSASQNPEPSPGQSAGLHPDAEVQRQRALTAVLSLSPLTVGDTLIAELYSPHLDQYQRMLILDSLAAAAVEMADPRKAPRLAAAAPGEVPKLLPSAAAAAAVAKQAGASTDARQPQSLPAAADVPAGDHRAVNKPAAAAPGMKESSSRVWGKVSLHKQRQAQAAGQAGPGVSGPVRTFRNRFAPVAVRWASLLLKECDMRKHGIDLFGRDSLLLGRLLTVLGTFVECTAATPAVMPLSAGLLEVLRAPQVSGHKEVFVRRCGLVAASQVVRHLPPSRLAGAMIGRQQDVQDAVLVERLQWLMGWAQAVAAGDVDEQCRVLAAGCVAWHVELAESALAALEYLPEPEGPSLSGVKGRKGVKGGGEGLEIKVPALQERLVLQ